MTAQVLVLRPEPGASSTAALATSIGLDPVLAPIAGVEPATWDVPDPAQFDALLVGSANVVRYGGVGLAALLDLPALAVGEATAAGLREAGFAVRMTGTGGLQSLLDGLAGDGFLKRLLRLAGEAHVPLEPPAGTSIATRIVYRVAYQPLSAEAVAAIGQGAIVLLHSGEAASHFAGECDRLGLARDTIRMAALAPRIAEAAGAGWLDLRIAPETSDRALLELARDMCH